MASVELLLAPAGRAFTIAVDAAVREAQRDDPLRPITVIVPSNTAGLSLRRLLGSNLLERTGPSERAGIANVGFATPFQFASTLAAGRLAAEGQRPLTTAVLAAAVRDELARNPGRFAAVAQHSATEAALVRAYAELTELSPAERAFLTERCSARTAEVIGFVETVSRHLSDPARTNRYHDEFAVLAAAAESLSTSLALTASGRVGSVVIAGPFEQGESTKTFLRTVASHFDGAAVCALTGDPDVDRTSVAQLSTITGTEPTPIRVEAPKPTRLIPAADTDEEVRASLRHVLALAADGERFDRMAVFYPAENPYARTLREQFDSAGVPTAGPDHRRLADSMAGRLLRRILDLAAATHRDERFSREDVMALVAAAPIRGADGKPLRSGSWEAVSRLAGVIGGVDDWSTKLQRHDEYLASIHDDPRHEDKSAGFFDSNRREREAARAMSEFVEWIDGRTSATAVGSSWSEWSTWARGLLDDLLPQVNRRTSWPETEIAAAERIEVICSRVGVLDELEPNASFSAFVRALELELEAPAGSRGRFGTGVLIAPLASASGLDVDHAIVVGMTEGVCPRPVREDTLVPDADRELGGGLLITRPERMQQQRRRYLAAVAAGSSSATLVMPLGDHRGGRRRTPSRWWLEAMKHLGAPPELTSQSWDQVELAQLDRPISFAAAATSAAEADLAMSIADLEFHRMLVATTDEKADDPIVVAGTEMAEVRRSQFSRFGGDLGAESLDPVVGADLAVSPTRLETWAGCPRRYFFAQVLGLGVIEPPDRIAEISPLDRGSMWHAILEDFIAESLPGEPHAPDGPDTPWTDDDRQRLRQHGERRFSEYEAAGVTGRPLLWRIEREKILADLDQFLLEDTKLRAELRTVPTAVELGFGMRVGGEAAEAATVELPDGRSIALRGFADRVDMSSDGTPVVLDYKTGNYKSTIHLKADPVLAGTKLQLGVYAVGAQQHYESPRSAAWYWYTSTKGEFRQAGYEWTTRHHERFVSTLQTIVDGIEGGLFPPNPGEFNTFFQEHDNCRYCAFTSICPRDRSDENETALAEDRLVEYRDMQNPAPFDEDESTP